MGGMPYICPLCRGKTAKSSVESEAAKRNELEALAGKELARKRKRGEAQKLVGVDV